MRRFAHAAFALIVMSGAAVAQQPLTYPGRSQAPGQQAIDTAACYADANKTTHVNMTHESQRPPPPGKAAQAAPRPIVSPAPLNPPLPAAMAASGASAAVAASSASGVTTASAPGAASGATAAAASGASGATVAAASGASGASGASEAMPSSASLADMPPPPPPEPPMVRYWTAYSKCMQQRGYYTR